MSQEKLEIAIFGAGCFWGVEDDFMQVKGVKNTAVGYMGGPSTLQQVQGRPEEIERATSSGRAPTYEEVCTGKTGHAEVTQVEYDPKEVSYKELLKVFWEIHDPTTMDRQGPDVGSQYRSVIFYHTPEQKKAAEKSKEELEASGKYDESIVTEIVPAKEFWRAEEYHQQYVKKTGIRVC